MHSQLTGNQMTVSPQDHEEGAGQEGVATKRLRQAKRYNIVVLSMLLAFVLPVGFVSRGLEPLSGDLTRIGGYSENDFGWHGAQERFDPPLAIRDRYDRPYDIVVLGDSFTSNPFKKDQTDDGTYWPNYLMRDSGLSVVRLSLFHTDLDAVLDNPVFQRSPPRLLILQVVERSLRWRLVDAAATNLGGKTGDESESCAPPLPSPKVDTKLPGPLRTETKDWERIRDVHFDFGAAVNQLYKKIARGITGSDDSEVINFQLKRADLFSSKVSDQLLVFRDDLRKEDWPATTTAAVRCNLLDAQNRVQANGATRMVTMIVPDKLTTYADQLASPTPAAAYTIAPLLQDGSLNLVDLLTPLHHAIMCGERDVYMPNDTHWGAAGHRIAAETMLNYIGRNEVDMSMCPVSADTRSVSAGNFADPSL